MSTLCTIFMTFCCNRWAFCCAYSKRPRQGNMTSLCASWRKRYLVPVSSKDTGIVQKWAMMINRKKTDLKFVVRRGRLYNRNPRKTFIILLFVISPTTLSQHGKISTDGEYLRVQNVPFAWNRKRYFMCTSFDQNTSRTKQDIWRNCTG